MFKSSMFYTILLSIIFISQIFATCPNGAVSSLTDDDTHCLFFISTLTAFWDAEKICRDFGGHLVAIHNQFDNIFISQEANGAFTDQTEFWIGATDLNTSPNWVWLDGSSMDFEDWDTGEPSTLPGYNCAFGQTAGGKWKADDCLKEKPYVCSVKVSSTTTVAPTTTTTKRVETTTTAVPCVDAVPDCQRYIKQCFEPVYLPLMYKQCRKTCNLCNACLDTDVHCPNWANNGFCTNPFYQNIWNECRKSCKLCT
jgi:hypothetical protein